MDTFKAIVWNQYYGSDIKALQPHLEREHKRGVSLVLSSESGGREISGMFKDEGFHTFAHGQWRVSWDPDAWPHVIRERDVRLSDTPYYSGTLGKDTYSEAAEVILCDHVGRTLTALSYHTVSGVQGKDSVDKRVRIMVEAFTTLGRVADEAHTAGFLSGGDDNWDEDAPDQRPFVDAILLGQAIGMRQLQAGKPTFGKREIDDFRILRGGNIVPVGEPWVANGGGEEKPAHKIHGREFRWKV